MNIKIKNRILLVIAMLFMTLQCMAITPQEVMAMMTNKLNSAAGISGSFVTKGAAGGLSGKFKFDGKRSYLETPAGFRQWYDGRSLWALNPNSKEVTLSIPEPSELKDANPLLYLQGYQQQYRLFFSKRKDNGRYLVLLNPRQKSSIKAIEVAVNKNTMLPERLIIRDNDDRRTTITISGLKLNNKFRVADFTYPATQFKGYELIDLR